MITQAERSNFLRQCWYTRRWKDGVGTLLLPLRTSLYQWRKDVLHSTRKNGSPDAGVLREEAPSFSGDVHPLFCDVDALDKSWVPLDGLFAEVDAQLKGTYRLAGGRCVAFDENTVEAREDVEDVHAYHRLYWALRYAEADAFGHPGASEALSRDLTGWLNDSVSASAIAHWPYTVAERIGSLSAILFWIGRSGNASLSVLVQPIKRQIWEDGARLSSTVEVGLGVHNHLLNDARGLFLAGAALAGECEQSSQWCEQAFSLWDEYFPKLVLEDGTFAEQSSHYHLLLCRTALEYWLACRRAGRPMPGGFETRIGSMFDLANNLLRRDGSLPRFGDNSPDRVISDLWGLLAAASHYGLLKNSPRHCAVTPLTIFYCGRNPVLAHATVAPIVRLFAKGGFGILRSAELGVELIAHGDGREGVGPHGDAGRGSYEIWWNGQVLVREPGSFFSSSNPEWRYYQGAEAQNVTSLDGLSPAIAKQDERFLARWYRPEGGDWQVAPGQTLEFRCDSFKRLDSDITLVRRWRFEFPDTLLFEETISGGKFVRFESRICLGDASWTSLEQKDSLRGGGLRWQGGDGSTVEMAVHPPENSAMRVSSCTFLPEYGVEKKGRVLILTGAQKLPCSWNVQWKFRKAS